MQADRETSPGRRVPVVKIIVGLVALAAVVVAFRTLPVTTWLHQFQTWVRGLGPAGYVLYAAVYALCCVLFLPASVLTLGAGAIFGLFAGTIVVVIGGTIGAAISFLLARTILRKRIESMTGKNQKFRALDKAIAAEGTKIVLLIRLAPVFPFTWINYAFGLTGIRFVPYILSTLFGIIPGTFAYVYLGWAAASAASGELDSRRKAIQIGGAIIAVIVTIIVARIAANAIKRAGVDEEPKQASS